MQQVAPTVSPVGSVGASALCAEVSTGDPHPLQGRQKGLFNFGVPEKRELFGERRKERSVYYKFYKIYSNTKFLSTRRALATFYSLLHNCFLNMCLNARRTNGPIKNTCANSAIGKHFAAREIHCENQFTVIPL